MNTPHTNQSAILIIDDEKDVLKSFELTLNSGGFSNLILCRDSREVMPLLSQQRDVEVILLDLIMPYIKGHDLLKSISEKYPEIPVIVITALNNLETAVECMKDGAFDYLVKPVEKLRLNSSVHRAIERSQLTKENKALKKRVLSDTLEYPETFADIATRNPAMLSIFQYIEAIADSHEPVLITGETGVGKELIARAIHKLSAPAGPFIGVNIAGLDDHNFSDTLFGHRKGAFTGADNTRDGLLRSADGGTLFLDEIGDLSQASQIKLLRLLQEQEYFPLGSDIPCKSTARLLTATHHDLQKDTEAKTFRRDLYFRLQTHQIHIPPLRDRLEDLPLLIDKLLERIAKKRQSKKTNYPNKLLTLLKYYQFPGNIRELEAMLYDAISKSRGGILQVNDIEQRIFGNSLRGRYMENIPEDKGELFTQLPNLPTLTEANDQLINEAMRRAKGNQSIASRFLGITQPALSRRLKRKSLKS